ncbi:uncharacterized protein PV09_04169 [Verruconis gallopava]|uniref:Zn(2)-C6 fungal-type domain-containing protein n=1 Tax=Verruconis gallopava TaxID=253628 RepID=A0A0D1YWI6_9PEZI|nr:uncharacterized protein PV09_04169 [Verruconis gallopava]KIW05012.1 hypothetical protein PV09_04169 [Verruconis gallopava]
MVVTNNSISRRTTKSGCKTCKIRKVKCDESRPSCSRCTSSGRTCDGYGIWGGGDNRNAHVKRLTGFSSAKALTVLSPTSGMTSLLSSLTAPEKRCFEWFTTRTIRKIPGPFALKYWDRLVVQACLTDSAVMHAVLAVGYVHSGGIECERGGNPAAQQQLVLQHYSKSIAQLQPHFSSNDRTCLRITLITCIAYISLELLQGRFQTAELHLENGLRVLQAFRNYASREPADGWIAQAFSRLCLQRALLRSGPSVPLSDDYDLVLPKSDKTFNTVEEAWTSLESILSSILRIASAAQTERMNKSQNKDFLRSLLQRQGAAKQSLERWLEAFDASTCEFVIPEQLPMVVRLLRSYYAMAAIMAATCLGDSESQYEEHTSDFENLVYHSTEMWRYRENNPMTRRLQDCAMSMAHSMVDLGWLPPLFFAATKCRVNKIRWQAIDLMEYATHREGMWDSKITAAVARMIVEAEETGCKRIRKIDVRLPNDDEVVNVMYDFENCDGASEAAAARV